mgnify:CR=1 FL=1
MSVLIGKKAETLALHYLQQQGLKLIECNFHSRRGEIDLIMQTVSQLVFVEVRYRKHQDFGHPAETVTFYKQTKLLKAAHDYLHKTPALQNIDYRFDVVCIVGTSNTQVEWIQNAFS